VPTPPKRLAAPKGVVVISSHASNGFCLCPTQSMIQRPKVDDLGHGTTNRTR
jgi:hypothetical protein